MSFLYLFLALIAFIFVLSALIGFVQFFIDVRRFSSYKADLDDLKAKADDFIKCMPSDNGGVDID